MPSISKTLNIEITPEQFIRACPAVELQELGLLLQSPAVQARMADTETPDFKSNSVQISPSQGECPKGEGVKTLLPQ